jgi:hypothetical protein
MRLDGGGVVHGDAPDVVGPDAGNHGGPSLEVEDDMADVRWESRTARFEVTPRTEPEDDGRHPGRLTDREPGRCNGVFAGQRHGDGHG